MSTPLFYPIPKYVKKVKSESSPATIAELCEINRISCKLTGNGANRQIFIEDSEKGFIEIEPNDGAVRIGVPSEHSSEREKYALAAMAYAVFDLAARASVKGIKDFCEIR